MGGVNSTQSQVSDQEILNKINNISNENCITSCTSSISDITADFENSTFEGDINIGSICNILGASCVLKASLSNDVQNYQKLAQDNNRIDEQDPLILFSLLAGDSGSQTNVNNQVISNRVTNILNSVCQNQAQESTSGVYIHLVGDTVDGNVNVNAEGTVSNTSCILDNVVRNTISNKQVATQKNKLMQGSPLLFAIIGIVIIAVAIMVVILFIGVGKAAEGAYAAKQSANANRPIYVR